MGRPVRRNWKEVITHVTAFEGAKMLGAFLGIHRQQALGMLDEIWLGYLRSVREEDEVTGLISNPMAKEKLAGFADYPDAERLYRGMLAAGFIEKLSVGHPQDPPQEWLRLRGASRYQDIEAARKADRERKKLERDEAREARPKGRKSRRNKKINCPPDIPRTSTGRPSDVPRSSIGLPVDVLSPPSDGRTVFSESSFSKPTDRPSDEPAQSLNSRGNLPPFSEYAPPTPPVPLASTRMQPTAKPGVDVGKRRREKRLAAKTSRSSYSVTVEADPFEAELDALCAIQIAEGIPARLPETDRDAAIDAVRTLRQRFSANALQNAFTALLRDPRIRERRVMPFLLSPALHLARLERAEAELGNLTSIRCVSCGDVVHQAVQLWNCEYVDACGDCFNAFAEVHGFDFADKKAAVDAWEGWLAGGPA